jgi:hypothetical protein
MQARQGLWLIALGCVILAACGGKPPPNSVSALRAAPRAAKSFDESQDDPCSLLEPKEVEAVLGAPLGVPPYRSSKGAYGPATNGRDCVYETADFHTIALSVDFKTVRRRTRL